MIPALVIASLTTQAAMPWAVVSDVVAAGIFSIVNTLLNGALLYMFRRHEKEIRQEVKPAIQDIREVTETVKLRKTDREGNREIDTE